MVEAKKKLDGQMDRLVTFAIPKYFFLSSVLLLRSTQVILAASVKTSCLVTHDVHQYRDTFVRDYVLCPSQVTDCDGIGKESSLNCYKCCNLPRKDVSHKGTILTSWEIALIASSAVVALTSIVVLPVIAIFVVRRRQTFHFDSSELRNCILKDNSSNSSVESITTSGSHQYSEETSSNIGIVGEPTAF